MSSAQVLDELPVPVCSCKEYTDHFGGDEITWLKVDPHCLVHGWKVPEEYEMYVHKSNN